MTHGDLEVLDDGRQAKWVGDRLYVTHAKTGRPLVHPYALPEVGDVRLQLSEQILKLSTALAVAKEQGIDPSQFNRDDLSLLSQRIQEWLDE